MMTKQHRKTTDRITKQKIAWTSVKVNLFDDVYIMFKAIAYIEGHTTGSL